MPEKLGHKLLVRLTSKTGLTYFTLFLWMDNINVLVDVIFLQSLWHTLYTFWFRKKAISLKIWSLWKNTLLKYFFQIVLIRLSFQNHIVIAYLLLAITKCTRELWCFITNKVKTYIWVNYEILISSPSYKETHGNTETVKLVFKLMI